MSVIVAQSIAPRVQNGFDSFIDLWRTSRIESYGKTPPIGCTDPSYETWVQSRHNRLQNLLQVYLIMSWTQMPFSKIKK